MAEGIEYGTRRSSSLRGDQKPLAIAMAKAGLLKPHHWIGDVENAIEEAFSEACDGIKAGMGFYLTEDVERKNCADYDGGFVDAAKRFRSENGLKDGTQVAALQIYNSEVAEWVTVGRKLEAFEKHHKGLGRTIMYVLEEAMAKHMGWMGPHVIKGLCEWTEWMGEPNERMRLEEYLYESSLYGEIVQTPATRERGIKVRVKEVGVDDLTPEQLKRLVDEWGGITKAEFDRHFPEWAFTYDRRNVLKLEKVKIAPLPKSTLAQTFGLEELLDAVVKLDKHTLQWGKKLHEANHCKLMRNEYGDMQQTALHGPFIVYFHENDGVTDRVLDGINDMESQCGEMMNVAYQHFFVADDPKGMRAAMELVVPICESLRMVEGILKGIGETR